MDEDKLKDISDLTLKDRIKTEDCHFHWFSQLNGTSELFEDILARVDTWILDTEDFETKQHCTNISIQLIKAISSLFCNKTQDALDGLNTASTYLKTHKDDSSLSAEHFAAYFDLIKANDEQIIRKINPVQKSSDALLLLNKFNLLSLDYTSSLELDPQKYKAAFLSCKAIFYGHIFKKSEKLQIMKQVVKLDAECWEFWDYLSRSIRSNAREHNFLSMPSDEEIHAVQRAFCLNPNSSMTLQRYSLLLEDTLKANSNDNGVEQKKSHTNSILSFRTEKEILDKMEKSIRKAAQLCPESYKVNIKLAEVLRTVAEYSCVDDWDACENEFKHCLKKWPTNSEVLHKAGKFYFNCKHNIVLALEYYTRSLNTDPLNYPCLIDKFKVYRATRSFDRAQDFLTDHLNRFTFQAKQQARLLRLQGLVYWIQGNQSNALNSCINSFLIDPKSACGHVWYELQYHFGIGWHEGKKNNSNLKLPTELRTFFIRLSQNKKYPYLKKSLQEYFISSGIEEQIERGNNYKHFFQGSGTGSDKCPW